ncbi:C1 family peptidase [Bdellovibrio sp. KM01]|uniref:C1 family peptidase n=1 Tax=Bdellovibrio sp. KM01 TaxID=2748865 RepID=UPI0015EAFF46|nr:C1 family peptidase [Bdellovibrio sp. KM01]QLY26750.1 C1 family peptidase [Bdellovibrio sp. KM01]
MTFVIRTLFFTAALLCSVYVKDAKAEETILTHLQTPVKDQERRNTCAYFAVSAAVESAFKTLTGEDYDISEEFEIFRHKIINAWRPEVEFGNTYDIMASLQNDLYLYEEDQLPYQKESLNFTQPFSAGQMSFYDLRQKKIPKVSYRSLKFKEISKRHSSRSWSELAMEQIKQNRSVVITLNVAIPHINDTKGTFTMNKEIAEQCASGQIACAGHAVLLVGYNTERRAFMFKNSWGPKWGDRGYGYVTFDHVDEFSDQPLYAYFDKFTSPSVKRVNP